MLMRASFIAFAVVVGTAFVVGCSQIGQSTSPTAPSSALTAPTSLAGGTSASLSQSSVFTPMARPAPSYNATGLWHEVITDLRTGEVLEEVNTVLTQDADGNITHCGECEGELWTFTRLSSSPGRILYTVSIFGEGSPCNLDASGSAQLNTTTNTITGRVAVRGPSDDGTKCLTLNASLVLTRIS